jgi:aspartyl-tRNA(Asn)/glutamyl-tRNA(Gln) amidotransferase subunit B
MQRSHFISSCCSKIFSAAATRFGAQPNSQACAVDLGLPGVLPLAVKISLIFGVCNSASFS